MAETLRGSVAAVLQADATLAAMLATYGGAPAVLGVDRLPPDVGRPFVLVDAPTTDLPSDTKTTRGRDRILSVRCIDTALAESGANTVDLIAERVRSLLHRAPVAEDGQTGWMAECEGPVMAPTDESLHGRAVSVRLRSIT